MMSGGSRANKNEENEKKDFDGGGDDQSTKASSWGGLVNF
jgi:hypothetical protein